MKSFPGCETTRIDSKIVLQENRSKITFLNPKQAKIVVLKVDGCVFQDNQILRCDYALVPDLALIQSQPLEIYVELKGSDISHAIAQLESTIKRLSAQPQVLKKLCFIVSTRVPRQTTSIQQVQRQFKQRFNASLRIKNIQDEYDLS